MIHSSKKYSCLYHSLNECKGNSQQKPPHGKFQLYSLWTCAGGSSWRICCRGSVLGQSQPIKGILPMNSAAPAQGSAPPQSRSAQPRFGSWSCLILCAVCRQWVWAYTRTPRSLCSLGKGTTSITLYNTGLGKSLLGNTALVFRGCC